MYSRISAYRSSPRSDIALLPTPLPRPYPPEPMITARSGLFLPVQTATMGPMCGRYVLTLSWSDLMRLALAAMDGPAPNFAPRYNAAPTQPMPVVRLREGVRHLDLLRWGLVPAWSKDASGAARLINARSETLAEKPSFRDAFRRRRCLVPAEGFYEWRAVSGRRQGTLIRRPDGAPFFFAGLWERWENAPDGRPLETFAIVTTAASPALAELHDRMPVVVPDGAAGRWLDPATPQAALADALIGDPGPWELRAVGPRVNSPRHDDPDCMAPLDPASPSPGVAIPDLFGTTR